MDNPGTTGTVSYAEGNTKTSASKHRAYCFTLNNYEDSDIDDLNKFASSNCKQYVFQTEQGKNGTPHLQGIFIFENARSFNAMKKINKKMHLEVTKDIKASIVYCCKSDTFTGQRFTNIDLDKYLLTTKKGKKEKNERIASPIEDPMEGLTPKDWQLEILELVKTKPNKRTIHWYYDTKGNIGKTSIAKSICIKNPNESLYLSGKGNDIKCGVVSFINNKENELKIAIFDFTRSTENYVSYEAIEAIKNGIFFSGKYESGMVIFNSPHVIIFANFRPDETALSTDRWNIRNITSCEEELINEVTTS